MKYLYSLEILYSQYKYFKIYGLPQSIYFKIFVLGESKYFKIYGLPRYEYVFTGGIFSYENLNISTVRVRLKYISKKAPMSIVFSSQSATVISRIISTFFADNQSWF